MYYLNQKYKGSWEFQWDSIFKQCQITLQSLIYNPRGVVQYTTNATNDILETNGYQNEWDEKANSILEKKWAERTRRYTEMCFYIFFYNLPLEFYGNWIRPSH